MGEPATSLAYSRGLDGLRGLAVVLVLLFHFDVPLIRGGLVGVSLFFTLSGYLITQLLLAEHARTGRVSLRHFWGRRLRRLIPASLVVLAAVAVLGATTDWFAETGLRGELLACLGYVANWRAALSGESYASVIAAASGEVQPSPVAHFWSLAIEEQFYIVFPVLMVGLLALHSRRVLWAVLSVLAVATGAASLLTESDALAYYGTHTRSFEILAGALLAGLVPLHRSVSAAVSRGLGAAGLIAALGIIAVAVVLPDGAAFVYNGGMSAIPALSVVAIAGVAAHQGLGTLIGNRALAWLGSISYGLYVFHWPVVLVLTSNRTGFGGVGLAIVRAAASVGLALLSHRFIEQPVRNRTWPRPGKRSFAALAVSVCLALGAIWLAPISATRGTAALAGLDAPSSPVQFNDAPPSDRIVQLADSQNDMRPDSSGGDSELVEERSVNVRLLDDRPAVANWLADSSVHGLKVTVSMGPPIAEPSHYDLVVSVVGGPERERLIAALGDLTGQDRIIASIKTAERMAAQIVARIGDGPGLIVETGSSDFLVTALETVDLAHDNVNLLVMPRLDQAALNAALAELVDEPNPQDPSLSALRVMVIGDSMSYGVAAALDSTGGDRFEVLWAGGQNCPIIEVYEVRWWNEVELAVDHCPTAESVWNDLVSEFVPDVVFVVASVPEQSAQRYEAGGPWFVVGDDEFSRRHAEGFAELRESLARVGAVTILATAPAIGEGPMSGAEFALPERVLGWNGQLFAWAETYFDVALVEFAALVHAAEAAAGSSLRPDAVHMEQHVFSGFVEQNVVPALVSVYEATVAEAVASGCLTTAGTLALERCELSEKVETAAAANTADANTADADADADADTADATAAVAGLSEGG